MKLFNQIIENLFIKKKYHYVKPCPHCGSVKTGFIINNRDVYNFDVEKSKLLHLLCGELVEIHSFIQEEDMLFCSDCGLNWAGRPEIKRLTIEEIEKQKEARGITEEYLYENNFTPQHLKMIRKETKKAKKAQEKQAKKQQKKENKTNNGAKIKSAPTNKAKETKTQQNTVKIKQADGTKNIKIKK